jgi:hypothetical protein
VTTNIQLAKAVAKHVQLRSIVLKSAHVESSIASDGPPEQISVSQQHRCTFEEKRHDEEREIHVTAEFRFVASQDGSGESSDVVKLDAAFVLIYSLPDDAKFDDRCAKYFAELNGAYNAWPYWRELVQTATGRVGLGGIMVPVYHPIAAEVPDATSPETAQPAVTDG